MSEDPVYGTTAEGGEQLFQYVQEALAHCIDELGYIRPLIVTVVSANGSVFVLRIGEKVDQLASHTEGTTYDLPVNVMITDSRGEATHMLLTNEGMQRLN